MTDVWAKWEGRVVNGAFPLRRFLGNSDHSVVFLTEYRPLSVSEAAIKFVPADPRLADGQLARWRTLRALSHPNLLRLFDSGHCQISGHPFFFVVMEYADQTLAQVLAQRPLTTDEVRELLPSTLDALEFLHAKKLVQGQLKPENLLVVGDQLKLASDTIRPAGAALPNNSKMSVYDAPEVRGARSCSASDTWGLGMTLVQALTQNVPHNTDGQPISVSLPGNISADFANTIIRCVSPDPTMRPTLSDLRAELEPLPRWVTPQTNTRPDGGTAARPDARSILMHPAGVAAAALLLGLLGWLGLRAFGHHSPATSQHASLTQPPLSMTIPLDPQPQSTHAVAPARAAVHATSAVLHQQLPAVPSSAKASIRGHFKVSVRVNVDQAGKVIAAVLQDPGPSKYFARLAVDAAKQWRFSPTDTAGVWLLQFAFSREKVTAQATPKA